MLTTFSHSSLGSFRRCPKQFQFRYVDKLKVPRVITPDTYLGTAVHRILRKLYKLGADQIVMPLEEAVAEYQTEWNKIDLAHLQVQSEHYTVDDYIRIGEDMLRQHYEKYQPFNFGKLLGTELYLSFELPNTPFKVRGYIDKLWRRVDGTVEICDYKTGMTIARPQDEGYRWQMGIYELAVRATWPQHETIEVAQHFLRQDEIVRYRMTIDDLDLLTEDIRNVVMEIHQADRTQNFPAQESPMCRYCDYQAYCPAKRHERMLAKQPDDHPPDGTNEAERLADLADRYLALYSQSNKAKAEMDALKEELRQVVRDGGPTKMVGSLGHVGVKLGTVEKFITKTRDSDGFAALSALAREMGFDEYFDLNARALFKQLCATKRLTDEQRKALAPFVCKEEESRITAKPLQQTDPEDE
ncbi:MAG: PD-(D/E)XK nuclease family protein [candidate division Zixibacteria bacterium]|nr:PD-(D/E)XK nuclease family protein [candidate division Zixibacteria bacterium]MDH3937378.1 PD-(D/E)XK nuclease family protein [candidate division Zixibacteria bacterium]MDH4033250.1 PD-(D/E)XK nuclease family protein [candidate division Zixibacteria bacterium]